MRNLQPGDSNAQPIRVVLKHDVDTDELASYSIIGDGAAGDQRELVFCLRAYSGKHFEYQASSPNPVAATSRITASDYFGSRFTSRSFCGAGSEDEPTFVTCKSALYDTLQFPVCSPFHLLRLAAVSGEVYTTHATCIVRSCSIRAVGARGSRACG